MTDKSINASERLETQIKGYYYGGIPDIRSGIWDVAAFNMDFWRNNTSASGINPTQSPETQV